MTETTETTETPETPEAPETETQATETAPEVTPLFRRLRETGEVGKKQWEAALAKTRALLARRTAEAAGAAATEAEAVAAEAEAEAETLEAGQTPVRPWARVRDKSTEVFGKAQERGAGILLDLVSRLREQIEKVETSLKQTRPAEHDDEDAPAAAA